MGPSRHDVSVLSEAYIKEADLQMTLFSDSSSVKCPYWKAFHNDVQMFKVNKAFICLIDQGCPIRWWQSTRRSQTQCGEITCHSLGWHTMQWWIDVQPIWDLFSSNIGVPTHGQSNGPTAVKLWQAKQLALCLSACVSGRAVGGGGCMSVSNPAVSESGLRTMRGDKHLGGNAAQLSRLLPLCVSMDGGFLLGSLQLNTHSHKCWHSTSCSPDEGCPSHFAC